MSSYAITNAKAIADDLTNSMSSFFNDTSIFESFTKTGSVYIIIISIVCIFLNSLIIFYASKDNLLKYKEKIIACSVISFFTATYLVTELFAILNIAVMATSKREKPEDYPPEKAKMPLLVKEKIDNNKIIMALIILTIYFSQFIWSNYLPTGTPLKIIVGILFYLLMIALSIIFFKDLLKTSLKAFKEHFKAYYQNLLPLIGKYYLVYIFIALMAAFLTKEITSANQANIMKLPLWYLIPLAVIYAPIVEETLFRGCLRRFIKNDKVFIIISALVFGFLHTISSETTIYNTFIMALPYMTMGGFLAYLYTKTNNILCNMSFHCFHNTLAIIILIIISL